MANGYPKEFDHALLLASAALAYMKKKAIPANPKNFLVWYEYFSGSNARLNEAARPLVQSNGEITDRDSTALYAQVFGGSDRMEEVEGWTNRIETVIGDVSRALAETDGGTRDYGQALQTFGSNLPVEGSLTEVGRMVSRIVAETQSMSATVHALQEQIADSAAQVALLTTELQRAREDAQSDALTGLANRKWFDVRLARSMAEAEESGEPLALVLADIDHFKKLNDTYGHAVGDQVLGVVGRTLMSQIKGRDTAARYGGEEFAVILPSTDLSGAVTVAETIRRVLAAKRLRRKGSDAPMDPLTMSFGVTSYLSGEAGETFIGRADSALYSAKRSGRNRVVSVKGGTQPLAAAG